MDVLLGWLLPEAPNEGGPVGFVLFALQVIVLIVQLVLIGRARRHVLSAERYKLQAEEQERRSEENARRAEEFARRAEDVARRVEHG